MLAQLNIRNFALIEGVSLEFQRGFNVLTGETGAGKSILIDALTAALGERAGSELVRQGAERATVEAVFELDERELALPGVREWAEDGVIILARELSAAGRSTCRINGRMCTAANARQVAADLIDIHGQHDHQSLLAPERHVEFLDAWAGGEIPAIRRELREAFDALREARREADALATGERERAHQLDLYRFQRDEIESAGLDMDEEAELAADRSRLANSEKLFASASAAKEALDGEVSALDMLGVAARELEAAALLDSTAEPLRDLLESAFAAAQEASAGLRAYLEGIEFNPKRLSEVQERLETYRALKRKYGDTVEEIQAYLARIAAELDRLSHGEERREELEERCVQLALQVDEAAHRLFTARRAAAERFEEEIAAHLADLNMKGTRFAVQLSPPVGALEAAEKGYGGLGKAEFLISANPGEPLRPLARIASGGEMSRVMLALKTAMAGSHPVALIFDEIDTGVGGRTAEALGAKMARLSRSNQVLCVTHLPQIASMAALHLHVSKSVAGERTVVGVQSLEGEARVGELARMLGGTEATAAQHARELLAAPRP